ncbi:MAG: SDR family oxidoreductase [Dehalococcoidia bacterium]|jgi:NAD(P)-dependent dehydrogenase (short-subunit alcohol dehydrogenase family)|nr:SDR family oxidoreductase [Dehalococcoidia bacterium]
MTEDSQASPQSLDGRVALVTGASSGIGYEAARQLAARGATVVLLCRDAGRGEAARARIIEQTSNDRVELLLADMGSQAQVRRVAAEFRERHVQLHILVNNAGAIQRRRELTEDGLERTFAANHLGTFLLTRQLLDLMQASAPARIINVASSSHARGPLDFADLDSSEDWAGMRAYGRSKLGNVMFSYELARRLEGSGVTVNAIHPGLVATRFGRGVRWVRFGIAVARWFMVSPEDSGADVVHLATASELQGVTGTYFVRREPRPSSEFSRDVDLQQRLWTASEVLVARSAATGQV